MTTQAPPPSADPASQKIFTIGTRKSKLALLQTDLVLAALKERFPDHTFKIHSRETAGDQNTTIALRDFTTKNLWTQELEDLLEAGHVDLIVHSLKGMFPALFKLCLFWANYTTMYLRCSHAFTVFLQAWPHDETGGFERCLGP